MPAVRLLSFLTLSFITGVLAAAELSGGVTATALFAQSGRADPALGASVDLQLVQPAGPGALVATVEANTETVAGTVPAVFPGTDTNAGTVQINGNNGGVQLSELKYRWDAPHQVVTFGLLDVAAYIDLAATANDEKSQFLNASLVNNQAIAMPDYTPGLVYEQKLGETQFFGLVTGSHGIGDTPDKRYGDLFDVDAPGGRLFGAAGLRHRFGVFAAEAGVWGNNADHPSLDGRDQTRRNYGSWGILGVAWEKAAFDLRAGGASRSVNPAQSFYSASFSFDLDFATMGMGWAETRLAPDARGAGLDDASVAEWYLRVPLGAVEATLDLQYVENPGFDATVPRSRIAGARVRYAF